MGSGANPGFIGIGTIPSIGKLQIAHTSTSGGLISTLYTDLTGSGTGNYFGTYSRVDGASTGMVMGINGFAVGAGSGSKTGVEGSAYGTGAGVTNTGLSGIANGPGNSYGMNSQAYGTGVNYGLFSSASGGTTNWAGYFGLGNVFIQNNLGIGTSAPTHALHVNGFVRISDGSEGLNKVLTSDASGVATWKQMAVGFKVEATGNQVISPTSYGVVAFDNLIFDDASAFNMATETYIVPSPGVYSFNCCVYWQSYPGTRPYFQLLVNGSPVQTLCDYCAANSQISQQITTVVKVNVGDQITAKVYNNTASPANISGVSGLQGTIFSGYKIY